MHHGFQWCCYDVTNIIDSMIIFGLQSVMSFKVTHIIHLFYNLCRFNNTFTFMVTLTIYLFYIPCRFSNTSTFKMMLTMYLFYNSTLSPGILSTNIFTINFYNVYLFLSILKSTEVEHYIWVRKRFIIFSINLYFILDHIIYHYITLTLTFPTTVNQHV